MVHGSRIAYRSAAVESLLATARKIARTDTTVLITGESGTGKEMFAHTLHELSGRNEQPLVVVDCGAIAPTLIESELFGHEKGAFTGAHTRKQGKLARADGGTVFLDEIGDLPLDLQSKLLRFVQEKQFTPVGGVEVRKVDVRIIAATNVDLRAKVAEGRVPRGPLPPPERHPAARPAAAGAAGRHPAPGHDLPPAVRRPLSPPRASLHGARHGARSRPIPGPATSASCRTWS